MKIYSLLIIFLSLNFACFSQTKTIFGIVSDKNGKNIEDVAVFTKDMKFHTYTDSKGYYEIELDLDVDSIFFSRTKEVKKKSVAGHTGKINIDVIFESVIEIGNVDIVDKHINSENTIRIDQKISELIPNMSGGIEELLKMLAPVSSRNELSSQYSVRGGSFDENLVYVNGIEVYRPQLIRSGQQEGLSFTNPMMVSSIKFSAGGFEAKYGDKTSSVLDIKYRKPQEFSAGASTSLLGSSVFAEGLSKNKKFSHISALRYKTNRYLLNSLETTGEYNPTFIDFQSLITYSFNSNLDLKLLGNISQNKFNFIPQDRSTSFGTISESLGIFVDFEGQETDMYNTITEALSLDYHPTSKKMFTFTISGYSTQEQENFDISGRYSLNALSKDFTSKNVGDSILNLGIGSFMNHARNMLIVNAANFAHSGLYSIRNHTVQWGANYSLDQISDRLDEWELIDSAGFSIPYTGDKILLNENIKAENSMITNRFSTYIQDSYKLIRDKNKYEFTAGVRTNYNTYNNQLLISPRIAGAFMPETERGHVFKFASGYYYQPPFYKEIRRFDGTLIENSKAQRSIHFLASNEFKFAAYKRYFTLLTEIYYKKLDNIIPYEVDNVRIRYYADQRAVGYAAGIDARVAGDFVPGIDSWFRVSFMKTEEDIIDIGNGEDDGYGYIPRPTDSRFSSTIFFQDYFPGNQNFKAHLNLVYSTGLPFGPLKNGRFDDNIRMPDYKRVDLGFSYVVVDSEKPGKNKITRKFKSIWLTAEVFNLLGVNNTVSYLWIRVVPNTSDVTSSVYGQYAIPNHLTSRRINFKITVHI